MDGGRQNADHRLQHRLSPTAFRRDFRWAVAHRQVRLIAISGDSSFLCLAARYLYLSARWDPSYSVQYAWTLDVWYGSRKTVGYAKVYSVFLHLRNRWRAVQDSAESLKQPSHYWRFRSHSWIAGGVRCSLSGTHHHL